jgi:formylmethanofuran dehydrogenase subunit E
MNEMSYDDVVKFHGHSCPGLAIGYRMTQAALETLRQTRAEDEELVAIVENDACGTDAVQYLSGCTFGKGNLIFRDYGKMVYTFYDRIQDKAVRISRDHSFRTLLDGLERNEKINRILDTPFKKMFKVELVKIDIPDKARLFNSETCHSCGESVMETRTVIQNGKTFCIPCSEN